MLVPVGVPEHHPRSSEQAPRGFTLIELMIVVAIIGVLAAIAIGAYTKNVRNARRTEVIGDLSNIALRQRAVFGIRGHFVSTALNEDDTYPVAPSELKTKGGKRRWAITDPGYHRNGAGDGAYFRGGGTAHGFDALNFMPEGAASHCAYGVISGDGTQGEFGDEPPGFPIAQRVFPPAEPQAARFFARDWFYAFAKCDLDLDGVFWEFSLPHYTSEIADVNRGE